MSTEVLYLCLFMAKDKELNAIPGLVPISRKRSSSAFPSSRRSIRSSKKRSASALCERSRRNSSFSLFLDFC